ncbi:MAG: T9SS C-terminal target domain-containing protein [Haliscomenobacteraceae bacterium CHB4]|nr:T9SS C-terminal target domain-containing protein [Haliscomenobacteraceae bacterium CHB4]
MKSNLISRNILLHLLATVWVSVSVVTGGWSQGLVKILDDAPSHYFGSDIDLTPSGNYRFASSYNTAYLLSNRATRHYLSEITPSGESEQETEYSFIPAFAWWLNDNTFLRVQEDWSAGDSVFTFVRSDAQNDTLWSQNVTVPPGFEYVEWASADVNEDGEIFALCIWITNLPTDIETRIIIVKFSPTGEVVWQVEHQPTPIGLYVTDVTTKIQHADDGGCLMVLHRGIHKSLLVKLDANGSLLWSMDTQIQNINDFRTTNDSSFIVLGRNQQVLKIDSNGDILWSADLENWLYDYPYTYVVCEAVVPAADGSMFILGKQRKVQGVDLPVGWRVFSVKISADGTLVWSKLYNTLLHLDESDRDVFFKEGMQLPDGDLLWAGAFREIGVTKPLLIRMDSTGVIFTNHLAGRVAYDASNDCVVQANEAGLPGWLLKLKSSGFTQYGSTDAEGNFYFADVDTGTQELFLYHYNYLWEGCLPAINAVIPPDSSDFTLLLDMPVRAVADCPVMTVDLAVPFLRRCFDNTYALQCCNEGNQTTTGAFVQVFLPQYLLLQGASHPFTQSGNKLTFQLGDMEPFECADIQLIVRPHCDSTELGQAMCLSARIYPDTICATPPGWSGALVEVSAACNGDSVRFLIQNTGAAPMNEALDFIIIDDHVMTREGNFNLGPGGQWEETLPADGSTYRLLADQEPNAPGTANPSVAVEGCVPGPGTPFTSGFVVQWPNENGSPFTDRECHELVGAFDPNDKQAAPQGVDDEHYIYPNAPIDYLIQFQNTGTDTAFTVILRDSLSPQLDPATVKPGASSHPYTWNLSGAGILTFIFQNIQLPDSNVNEPSSRGFVQFKVQQKPDLPDGTMIENRAGIYFDFNEPVITNTVFHTVMRNFVPTVSLSNPQLAKALAITPNPAETSVWVLLESKHWRKGLLRLHDSDGRAIREISPIDPVTEIQRNGLPSGVYFVTLRGENGQIQSGKIIWK